MHAGTRTGHISALKQAPEVAEPLLVPRLAEADKYAQDSVANWLNDASKTRPDWVIQLFNQHPPSCKASRRIHTRATRSLPL
jgi:3-methyladenine DNA glycosylase AlkC